MTQNGSLGLIETKSSKSILVTSRTGIYSKYNPDFAVGKWPYRA